MFVLVPSLSFALLNVSGNSKYVQATADYALSGYLTDPSLRLYLFEGLVILSFLVLAVATIGMSKRSAVAAMEEIE